LNDTISAIATAAGPAAIGIVRISGPDAEAVLRRCFRPLPSELPSHKLLHGWVIDPSTNEPLDEGLAVFMRAPKSYTGEHGVELQVHGGSLNLRRIFEATLSAGARQAQAGEFSLRAFLNGRIDLVRAEAIAELIHAESDEALRVARAQLGGALSKPIEALRLRLLELLVMLEGQLDFGEEDELQDWDSGELARQLEVLQGQLALLLRNQENARWYLGGLRVAFLGPPNVGKSSLFNLLLGADRAIVTERAGTTRDVLEESLRIEEQRFLLSDTAGLATQTDDPVERIGIARSLSTAEQADVLVWLLDAAQLGEGSASLPPDFDAAARLLVVNKVDLLEDPSSARLEVLERELRSYLRGAWAEAPLSWLSARSGEGRQALEKNMLAAARALRAQAEFDMALFCNLRQVEAVRAAAAATARAVQGLAEAYYPLELLCSDVREAAEALGSIVGVIAVDEVLDGIFARFCIGK
jgi:tRNA modification GTPase